jgi:hypothetical protein
MFTMDLPMYHYVKNPEQYKDRGAFLSQSNFNCWKQKEFRYNRTWLLRRSSIKWSLGMLHKLFLQIRSKIRVKDDYRIHFSLNCGAKVVLL